MTQTPSQSRKKLLITGGAGYIGSHTVVALEQSGYDTIIADNLVNSSRTSLDGIARILGYSPIFYEGDIGDSFFLEEIFRTHAFDGVIHFAGLKSVGESTRNIAEYHRNNIGGSMVLFGHMEKYGVRKIVFSSSATVYHSDNLSPFTEDMPLGTTNPYGTTKLVIEKLLEDYARDAQWSVIALRYFNPIGAHPSVHIGEIPNGIPNNLLPYVLDVARGVRPVVSIFGDDYDTPDGTGVRDYIDVNDLADAHIAAYSQISQGYIPYNIGTGRGTSVLELIEGVREVSGKNIPTQVTDRRAGDLACVIASSERFMSDTGWYPKRSLSDSVQSAWLFSSRQIEC